MHFDIFSIFPQLLQPYLEASILQRAIDHNLIDIKIHNIRDWTSDRHHTTDDTPYGGGGGMVMKPDPVFEAVESIVGKPPKCPVILMTPQGKPFNQQLARQFAGYAQIVIICGRYEGIDERIRTHLATEEISIGDYVLTGGELPALIIVDAVARLLPGVLGDPDGAEDDSHSNGLLEYPHYTRPPEFRGLKVPDVLLSGNHATIARWRRQQSLLRTYLRRPDLFRKIKLSPLDQKLLDEIIQLNSINNNEE
jgi:tRNA (guanine37-N1)-methyltransferase